METVSETQETVQVLTASSEMTIDRAQLRRRILRLAGPALVEYMLQSLVGVVNMIMVGSLGPEAIAAVGIINHPVQLIQGVFSALFVGTTALVARFVGAGDIERARAVSRQSVSVTLLLGLAITLPQVFMARGVVLWMGAEPGVVESATVYMQVIVAGTVFTVIPLAISAIMRGAGDTRTPMFLNVLTNVMNAAFGYTLIYGHLGLPKLGVPGAALGTILSRGISCVLFVLALYGRNSVVPLSFRESHRLQPAVIARILRIGVPAALEQLIMRSGQTIFSKTVASLGTLSYAAHQLTSNAESLAWNLPTAFQVSATTLSGQYLGAEQPDTAERSVYENVKMSLVIIVVVGVLCYVFAVPVIELYTDDDAVIGLAVPNVRIFSLALVPMNIYFVVVGALRGAGDTKWPLYISIICMWFIRVSLGYTFAIRLGFGLKGAWVAMAIDYFVRAAIVSARFRSGGWKATRV